LVQQKFQNLSDSLKFARGGKNVQAKTLLIGSREFEMRESID
jgi:hypothetical protein